ncbi:MAG: bifunctional serine/threonine protein kinase/MFS transporter [Polyangiaceae bacterium]
MSGEKHRAPAQPGDAGGTMPDLVVAATEPDLSRTAPDPDQKPVAPSKEKLQAARGAPDDADAILGPASLPTPSSGKEDEPRYDDRGLLGVGGMGEVRLVRDRWMGRDVALKVIRDEALGHENVRARFLREIRVQGQLEHPGIVPVYDVGSTNDNEVFFTMRRIRGETLADILAKLAKGDAPTTKRMSRRKLLAAFTAVCNVVHYAHSRGVVHRDLKPANVMLGDYGEVYVLDWGVAKVVGVEEPDFDAFDDVSTARGKIVGTIAYMAPEQARGEEVDRRADVYALGSILFEILALEPLLVETSIRAALKAILAGIDGHPSKRRPSANIPVELDRTCARATALDPAARFATARELSDAVEQFLDGDRDLERRREIGQVYMAAARSAMRATSTSPHASRLAAMRDLLRAVALAPEERAPVDELAHLILDPPGMMPAEAIKEKQAQDDAARSEGSLLAYRGFASFLLTLPMVIVAGVRAPWFIAIGFAVVVGAALYARQLYARRATNTSAFLTLLALASVIVISQAAWLGPFVLTPIAATTMTALFGLYAAKKDRLWVFASGAVMALVPFALELVPGVPKSFAFRDGYLVLLPRVLDLPPVMTTIGLIYTTLGYVLLPATLFVRLKDKQRMNEDRVFYQAWMLKQLFPKRS